MKLMETALVERLSDNRRKIVDCVFPEGFFERHLLPGGVRQFKDVISTQIGQVVGNHFHTLESGRFELFVVIGPEGGVDAGFSEQPPIIYTYRFKRHGEVQSVEQVLCEGDIVWIEPGMSHAFLAHFEGSMLRGISNTPYNGDHDVVDKLF